MCSDRPMVSGHTHLMVEMKIAESCTNNDKCFSQKGQLIPEASAIFPLSEHCQVEIPASTSVVKA